MSQQKAIVDKLLTNVSNGLFQKEFVAEQMFPQIKHAQYTGKLGKYGTNHLRIEVNVKGGRAGYRRVEAIARSTDSFHIVGHGLEGMVTKEDRANVESPFDAEKDEAIGLTSLLQVDKEKAFSDVLGSTSIMTQNVTLGALEQYNDYLNSDPIDDFATARAAVKAGCGALANGVEMSWEVYNKLRFHPQILDALGYKFARPGGLTENELAVAMGVEKLFIGSASYESAKEGQASSLAPIWGKNILFGVFPDSAQPYQVALGYLVVPTGGSPRKVYKYNVNNPPDATGILVEDEYDIVLANDKAGYLIKDAIA